jgi:hypothetical protein
MSKKYARFTFRFPSTGNQKGWKNERKTGVTQYSPVSDIHPADLHFYAHRLSLRSILTTASFLHE